MRWKCGGHIAYIRLVRLSLAFASVANTNTETKQQQKKTIKKLIVLETGRANVAKTHQKLHR